MKWFSNLNTGLKLALGFGMCLVLAVIVGSVAVTRMSQMNKIATQIASDPLPSAIQGAQMSGHSRQFRLHEFRHLLTTDAKSMQGVEAQFTQEQAAMDKTLADYGKNLSNDEDRQNWEAIKTLWAQYLQQHAQFLPLSQKNNTKAGTAMLNGPMYQTYAALSTKIDALVDFNQKNGQALSSQATATYNTARLVVMSLLAIAVLLGCVIALVITRYMVGTLRQVSGRLGLLRSACMTNLDSALKAAALGDVTAEVKTSTTPLDIDSKDEFGELAQTFNALLHQVQSSVSSFDMMMAGQKEKVEIASYIADGDLTHSVALKSDKDALGKAFTKMVESLSEKATVAALIADGDISRNVTVKSDKDALGKAFVQMIESLTEKATVAALIADGDLTHSITIKSDKDVLGKAFIQMSASLTEKVEAAKLIAVGDVNCHIEPKSKQDALGFAFVQMIESLTEKAAAATSIAEGDLSHRITVKSDKDTLGKAFVQMSASLTEKVEVAKLIAGGNLNCHVEPKSEKDALGHAFVQMIDSLSTLVSQATQAANTIAASSSEVSAGNEDLSQRTEEQASSLEETAASMEEMTATVKQNADNARQANQFASQARTVAEKGGSVVESAVTAMSNISSSSKRIADIISVIDEIAFQTNLLALNAAVEAARVGEQGRGFAVVAAEVRNLAGRSATAAKEIKALVLDSVQKVEDGSELVNQSGEQLREIVTSVKKVADIIAEISAAGQEQAIGIEQVNKAIMQMDQITQQNASLVEEASATSQVMNQQAQSLQTVVAQFKISPKYQSAQQQPIAQKATGTYGHPKGRSSTNRSSSASLKLVNEDEKDFEEF